MPQYLRLIRAALVATTVLVPVAGAAQRAEPAQPLSAKAMAQIDTVRRAVATRFADPRDAEDAGYQPVLGMVPLQGVHYVRPELIDNGTFDLDQPPVLMYAPVAGKPKLVGVAYAYEHARSKPLPEGFDGPNDDWHTHAEFSRDPSEHIVMVHVWLTESPGGPFARYNTWLPYMAASLERPSAAELNAPGKRGERARRFAFALAMATHPPQLFDLMESRGGPDLARLAHPHRRALMGAVDGLTAAERRGDKAAYDRLMASTVEHADALMAAYRNSVKSPRAKEFIDRTLDELMGLGHEGHHSMPGTKPGVAPDAHKHSPAQ